MQLITKFARDHPWQSVVMLLALLLAGIAEGAGLSALLPLLNIAISATSQGNIDPATALSGDSKASELVNRLFEILGVEPSIGALLLIIVIALTCKAGIVLLAKKYIGYTVAHVTTNLRLQLLRATLSSRYDYFISQPIGKLANSMASETIRASQAYLFGTMVISLLIQCAVYASIAMLVSWQATIAALASAVVVLTATHCFVRKARKAGLRQTTLMKSLLTRLTDTLQSVKPLKAMAREELADNVLASETMKLNRALRKEVYSKVALNSAQEPLFAAMICLGIYIALVHANMSLPTVIMLVLLLGRLLDYLGRTQKQFQKLATAESAYWSLQDVISEAEQAREASLGQKTPTFQEKIHFDDVQFSYGNRTVLDGLCLSVPINKLTTLIGASGAGKTTIIDLVCGLIQPQAGHIYIDGEPLSNLAIKEWRRMIGYVPQENLLLHDSVQNNVTLADPELEQDDAEHALRLAGAWDFVSKMPEGINSSVGERGARLSGGQRQRVMIARALVHKPRLLILDEATSALDPASEAAICETLKQLRGKITMLAISHEPALVRAADCVYQLQNNKAVMQDSSVSLHPASTGR